MHMPRRSRRCVFPSQRDAYNIAIHSAVHKKSDRTHDACLCSIPMEGKVNMEGERRIAGSTKVAELFGSRSCGTTGNLAPPRHTEQTSFLYVRYLGLSPTFISEISPPTK
jgi:hypothetical protein